MDLPSTYKPSSTGNGPKFTQMPPATRIPSTPPTPSTPSSLGQSSPCPDSASSRPLSALARGVQIVEFNDSRVNPSPIYTEEADVLMEEYLAPPKLVRISDPDLVRNIFGFMTLCCDQTKLPNQREFYFFFHFQFLYFQFSFFFLFSFFYNKLNIKGLCCDHTKFPNQREFNFFGCVNFFDFFF